MDITCIGASCCGDARFPTGFDRVWAPCVCLAAFALQAALARQMPIHLSHELLCGSCPSGSWRKRVLFSHLGSTNVVNELDKLTETAAVACTDARVGVCAQLLGSADM
jgi:hypothetical protein